MEHTESEIQDRNHLLNFARKEGYADPEDWTEQEKWAYYYKCQAYEPDQDEELQEALDANAKEAEATGN